MATVVWNKYTVPEHVFISWLAAYKRLLTMNRLQVWYPTIQDINCVLCGVAPETQSHLLFECGFSMDLLQHCGLWLQLTHIPHNFQR